MFLSKLSKRGSTRTLSFLLPKSDTVNNRKKKNLVCGFTLVELLVVIAVISLLASVITSSLGMAKAKARDSKRIRDLNELRTALELYYDEFGQFPNNTDNDAPDSGCWSSWDAGNATNLAAGDPFLQPLIDNNFISETPREKMSSVSGQTCLYRYMRATNACGCPGTWAVLYTKLETTAFPPASQDDRPDCCTAWHEGQEEPDYAIYLKE